MSKLPADIPPKDLESQFDREYFVWNGKGEAKGYRGAYADFPESLKFLDYIKSLNPESVLDAGCAYGFLVKRLNDNGILAEGFDVSTFAYKMRATDRMRVASVLDLSYYKDKQFDLVVSIELLEHIPEAHTGQVLKDLARVSKRGVHWIAYKEVDDLFQTKDITHVNIKPYQWWVDKVAEVCGPTHKVIYKETDWYPKPVAVPSGGPKRGLNVGSFVNMLLNTDDTAWLNVDVLDLSAYAKAYGYNFQRLDAHKLPFSDNSYDYIVASHFLEHLTPEEGLNFLRDCHRVLKPEGIIRLAVPDSELLIGKYAGGELGYFDEINPECEKAETPLGKLHALLWGGHKSVYDRPTLSLALEEAGFKPIVQSFNRSSRPDLMRQIFDYHPDLSLYMEGIPLSKEKPSVVTGRGKLRLGLISTPMLKTPPRHYGGLEAVVADLAEELAKKNDVTVFAARGSKIPNVEVVETVGPFEDMYTDWLQAEMQAYEVFKDRLKEFDIIHGNDWFGCEYLAKMSDPSLKICHTHHGALTGWRTKPVEKMNMIAISDWMVRVYKSVGYEARRVYNGINLDRYSFKKEKGENLLFVGRIVPFKGPHIALEVADKLNMHIDFVGGVFPKLFPEYTEQFRSAMKSKDATLYPDAPHEKKLELMQNAKCLLFPSNMGEPFGLCPTEAGACGCPVIGFDDGAVKEVVEDGVTGFVVPKTVEAMAEAVKKIDKIKPEACRDRVERLFSRQTMARNYLKNVYEPVLRGEEW